MPGYSEWQVSERYPRLLHGRVQDASSLCAAAGHSALTLTKNGVVHPYAIKRIIVSGERNKCNGTSERQFLLKWQEPKLKETPENFESLRGLLTPEDLS